MVHVLGAELFRVGLSDASSVADERFPPGRRERSGRPEPARWLCRARAGVRPAWAAQRSARSSTVASAAVPEQRRHAGRALILHLVTDGHRLTAAGTAGAAVRQ